jgi:hypothetical protein
LVSQQWQHRGGKRKRHMVGDRLMAKQPYIRPNVAANLVEN